MVTRELRACKGIRGNRRECGSRWRGLLYGRTHAHVPGTTFSLEWESAHPGCAHRSVSRHGISGCAHKSRVHQTGLKTATGTSYRSTNIPFKPLTTRSVPEQRPAPGPFWLPEIKFSALPLIAMAVLFLFAGRFRFSTQEPAKEPLKNCWCRTRHNHCRHVRRWLRKPCNESPLSSHV